MCMLRRALLFLYMWLDRILGGNESGYTDRKEKCEENSVESKKERINKNNNNNDDVDVKGKKMRRVKESRKRKLRHKHIYYVASENRACVAYFWRRQDKMDSNGVLYLCTSIVPSSFVWMFVFWHRNDNANWSTRMCATFHHHRVYPIGERELDIE